MADIAQAMLDALDSGRQIDPITGTRPDFGLDEAYHVSASIMDIRIARGERPVGWKIGFTNRIIWDEYGVHAPIWGPVYDTTTRQVDPGAAPATLDVARLIEPRIEPEIIFRVASPPRADMDDIELLGCIDGVAHGFEIVQSIYPGWRFQAADTVAAFAMHAALVHGPFATIEPDRTGDWIERLASFEMRLSCNGEEIDRGQGHNVLDGPLSAFRHFVAGHADRPMGRLIEPGDLVTTGTVTRAFPVEAGQTWSTELVGLDLPAMALRFG